MLLCCLGSGAGFGCTVDVDVLSESGGRVWVLLCYLGLDQGAGVGVSVLSGTGGRVWVWVLLCVLWVWSRCAGASAYAAVRDSYWNETHPLSNILPSFLSQLEHLHLGCVIPLRPILSRPLVYIQSFIHHTLIPLSPGLNEKISITFPIIFLPFPLRRPSLFLPPLLNPRVLLSFLFSHPPSSSSSSSSLSLSSPPPHH